MNCSTGWFKYRGTLIVPLTGAYIRAQEARSKGGLWSGILLRCDRMSFAQALPQVACIACINSISGLVELPCRRSKLMEP